MSIVSKVKLRWWDLKEEIEVTFTDNHKTQTVTNCDAKNRWSYPSLMQMLFWLTLLYILSRRT